jgi:glycosyltransferase involved in cell wall biosynthesis
MTRVALLCSEPIRAEMAGIGIRYLELARRLPRPGLEVVLVSPAEPGEAPALPCPVRRFARGGLPGILADCDAAVAQGQLANDLLLELPLLPTAIDLYDPWLVENLSYHRTLGFDPWRNDHATWVLQLSRGDFFLCSSQEQRLYYLGFLTALGRVNPERLEADPDLARLIAAVPFGIPTELPPHRAFLEPPAAGERRLLFGGLYDWYDPWTLLAALERLEELPWSLFLIRNPNPQATPQELLGRVEEWCRRRGWWQSRVRLLPWVPAERRYDLLRDVDLLVAPHRSSLETRLSLRTRFLDALAVGCPVVVSEGGTVAALVARHEAGWVVPQERPEALAAALRQALGEPVEVARRVAAGRRLAEGFAWEAVLAPLVEFCREPRRDPTRERFAFQPATVSPPDPLAWRLRRRLRRALGRWAPQGGGA